jgi:cell volume regulation protein A
MLSKECKFVETGVFLVLLGGLVVLAFLAEEAFQHLRVPPVLLLIGSGLVLGPVSGLLPAQRFAEVAPHFGALAFLLILFEGGLELDLKAVMSRLRAGATLAVLSFGVSLLVGVGVGLLGGLGSVRALAFGVILAPVSGAIVIPVAGRLGLGDGSRTTVVLEAALADTLAVLGMALVAKLVTGGGLAGLVALGSVLAALFSVIAGVVAGLLWPRVLRWLGERRFVDVLTFGVALALWGLSDVIGASGALVVLLFGLTLANEGTLLGKFGVHADRVSATARHAVRRLHGFIGEITFLVRTFFFVFLGIVVRFTHLPTNRYLEALAVVVLFLAVRALVLGLLATWGILGLKPRERVTVWLLQPRGLVSAVLAIEAAHLGLDNDGTLLGVASLVILATNVLLVGAAQQRGADEGRLRSGSTAHP